MVMTIGAFSAMAYSGGRLPGTGRAAGLPANAAGSGGDGMSPSPVGGEAAGVSGERPEASPEERAGGEEKRAASGERLTGDEEKEVEYLRSRDSEVRQHERAHQSAGAGYAGSASFTYQQGPDGKRYAVGGEVSIDTSEENDPEATIRKMRIVKAAALAPAEPSGQDRAVASMASRAEANAQRELARLRRDETESEKTASRSAAARPAAYANPYDQGSGNRISALNVIA